ncbi:HNH endonuclease, partial [Bacillus cereus]|uniref:HNH endonuclease n=1 Tax=Bacillus cereus TaxID=1396 RepID=UPI001F5B1CCE
FWNGDLESREHYVAYGIATLGLGLLGDKGLSKAGRMQLVDYETHRKTGHTGGYKILGKDSDK